MRNQDLTPDVADRIAQRTLSKREAAYASEVRRLLDAGLEAMQRGGTATRPRVSDIVAAAGLSNEAFYRHFPSKDALVAAILEDGTERLASYLSHHMAKEATPEAKVRRWVSGVLSQAVDEEIAATTLAVLWNAGGSLPAGRSGMDEPLAELLWTPLADLGSVRPELDAALVAHAVVGLLADYLERGERPGRSEVGHVADRCLAAVRPPRRGSEPPALT